MATNVFELFGKLSLDSNDFEQGLVRAKGMASSFGGMLSSAAQVGIKAIGAATTAAVGFAGASVKVGADFDKSMSQVAATMGKTTDEIVELRDFAQEMGRTTMFSATQAADALNFMALAGYDAETSMSMLPNVLNLAAAGSMDLARASDMVTDTQTAFGISLERTSQLVDEMAKAASTGNTSVEQLGDAFLVVGGLAQELNGGLVTLEDGTTQTVDGVQELEIALTAMANAGIKGSEAGTHMRNMLMKLSGPSSDGAKALEAMGVKVFDTTGKMRSLKDVFGDLNEAMSTMTQEQKIQTISDLFNARDLSSAEAMLNAVSQDWDKIGASIVDAQGAASAMAETQMDNLAGDITYFKSALEGAQIAISDGLTPSLREFVQFGTQGLSELTSAFKEGGLNEAMASFGDILGNGLSMVLTGLPQWVEAGTTLLSALVQGIIDNLPQIGTAAVQIIDFFLEKMTEATETDFGTAFDGAKFVDGILNSIMNEAEKIFDAGLKIVGNISKGILYGLPEIMSSVADLVVRAAEKISDPSTLNTLLTSGMNIIMGIVAGIVRAVPKLLSAVPVIINNLFQGLRDSMPQIISDLLELAELIIEALPDIITTIAEAIPEIIAGFADTITSLLPVLIEGIVKLVELIAENLPDILDALIDAIPTIIQAILDGWMTAIPAIVQALIQLVSGIVPHIPEIIMALIQAIPQIIEAIIEGFRPMIENFINLFGEIGTAITEWWAEKKQEIANGWNDFLAGVKEWFANLPYELGLALGDMIAKFGDWLIDAEDWVTNDLPQLITDIVDWFKGLPGRVWEWLVEVVNKFTKWREEGQKKVDEEIPKLIDGIAKFFEELPEKALTWGKDMISGFIEGIGQMAEDAWNAVSDFAQGIADRLGFSEPELGPLSNFHTYAPDMMKLFAQGVEDSAYIVNDAIEDTFDFSDAVISPEVDYQRVYQSDASSSLNKMVALLQEIVDHGLDVGLEGDAADIFHVVEKENRQRTKATNYNSLAMAGG